MNLRLCSPLLAALIAGLGASAQAIDKVDSPDVNEGELDFEYSGNRTFDAAKSKNNLQDTEALIAYAPTSRWEVDVGGFFSKEPDQSFRADGVLVENFFQFFEKGSHWVDSGVMISCDCSTHAGLPSTLETKLLLEKDIGSFSHIANIGLAQDVGPNSGGGPDRTFEWSSRYNLSDSFAPGFEIQSDFGKADTGWNFAREGQYIGPAIYGQVLEHFNYEVVYLAGVSEGSSASAVRFLFQYETHF